MAKVFYLLKQNKNSASKIFGKWFAQAKSGGNTGGGSNTPSGGGDNPGEGD